MGTNYDAEVERIYRNFKSSYTPLLLAELKRLIRQARADAFEETADFIRRSGGLCRECLERRELHAVVMKGARAGT